MDSCVIKKYLKNLHSLQKILCSAYTQCTQNNCVFPNKGPIKKIFAKLYYLCISNYETVLYLKSEPKKFSRLCTFKAVKIRYFIVPHEPTIVD
jgi:hypothetical protein